jgi:hypothetical protein
MHFPHDSIRGTVRVDREQKPAPEHGSEVQMKIEELLRDDERTILDEAVRTTTLLSHYRRDGEEATRRRVQALHRAVARAVSVRDLDDLLAHAKRIGRERFHAGFEQAEVEAAFATLEEAIERRALSRMTKDELAWGLGLVATALGHARAEVGRTFAALAHASRPGAVDLTSVFRRTDPGGCSFDELVYPV